jgi:endonuclease/exonuclease/phosphatase family metal-dependent hydrolase
MGDLNAGRRSVCRVSGLRSAGSALTFPAHFPTRQIDHVLVDGTSEPATVSAPRQDVSDHRPLVVDLSASTRLVPAFPSSRRPAS